MNKESIEYNGLKAGLFIFLGLLAFFIIMKAVGLIHNLELRALNLLIMASGVYFAIKSIKKVNSDFDYFKGIGTGVLAALSSSIGFAIFNVIYLLVIDPAFMLEIKETEPFSNYLNPLSVAVVIFMEGASSGALLSFGFMQWFKSRENQDIIEEKEIKEESK
jgi:hypothetical protein